VQEVIRDDPQRPIAVLLFGPCRVAWEVDEEKGGRETEDDHEQIGQLF
jgi:hypothetical protein